MTVAISLLLTLLVFSYLLGDNILYRLTVAVFVGLAAAFTSIITIQSVIVPLASGFVQDSVVLFIAGVITLLLLLKPFASLKSITNLGLAVLISVGAAVAVVGALTGTLVPLALQTGQMAPGGLFDTLVIAVAVITSLLYFQYLAQRQADGLVLRGPVNRILGNIGKGFIAVTLGAIYAAAILTSLSILTGHLSTLFAV